MVFSSHLKSRRKELGLTLNDIANLMGVSEATVQRWESGAIKNLRYERISALASVLNVSPAYLMGWTEPGAEQDAPTRESVATMLERMLRDTGYLRDGETLTPELLNSIGIAVQTAIELYRKQYQ